MAKKDKRQAVQLSDQSIGILTKQKEHTLPRTSMAAIADAAIGEYDTNHPIDKKSVEKFIKELKK